MRAVEYLQRRPLRSIIAAGVVLGLLVGVAWPLPEIDQAAAGDAVWDLPPEAAFARYSEARFVKVRSTPMWGADGSGSGGAASKRPTWRLTGIITDPIAAALVVAQGDRKVAHIKVGGSLPGGGKIVQITSRGLTFARDGCTYERILYSTTVPNEASCTPPAAAAQRPQPKHE